MDREKLEQAEAHLHNAESQLGAAKAAERAAISELQVAEEAEQVVLKETEKALQEIEEAERCQLIHFTVDGERYETDKHQLTANQIIRDFADRDPATHYLKELSPH